MQTGKVNLQAGVDKLIDKECLLLILSKHNQTNKWEL